MLLNKRLFYFILLLVMVFTLTSCIGSLYRPYVNAYNSLQKGDLRAAEEEFKTSISGWKKLQPAENPMNPFTWQKEFAEGYMALAEVYRRQKSWDLMSESLRKAEAIEADNMREIMTRFEHYPEKKQKMVFAVKRRLFVIYALKAEAFCFQDKYERALSYLETLESHWPSLPPSKILTPASGLVDIKPVWFITGPPLPPYQVSIKLADICEEREAYLNSAIFYRKAYEIHREDMPEQYYIRHNAMELPQVRERFGAQLDNIVNTIREDMTLWKDKVEDLFLLGVSGDDIDKLIYSLREGDDASVKSLRDKILTEMLPVE